MAATAGSAVPFPLSPSVHRAASQTAPKQVRPSPSATLSRSPNSIGEPSPSGPSPSLIRKLRPAACPAAAAGRKRKRPGKGGAETKRPGKRKWPGVRGRFPWLGEMAALVARQGRELQRYTEDGHRLVVGCIPYKFEWDRTGEHGIAVDRALQVLVVSAQKGREMLFPRGGWESDESIEEATSREAMEEAGVLGDVEEELGRWWYQSKSHDSRKVGIMFPLNVTEELHQWPEMGNRRRRWVTVAQARETCQQVWMLEALDILVERLSRSTTLGRIAEQPNRGLLGKMNRGGTESTDSMMPGPAVPTSSRKMECEPVVGSPVNVFFWIVLSITSRMTLDVHLIPVNDTRDFEAQ